MDYYGTLGPACRNRDILKEMFLNGMTGIRLNLSHITLQDAAEDLALFHEAADLAGVKPQLLIDMQGPELRIGKIENGSLNLKEGETVLLTAEETFSSPLPVIPVPAVTLPWLKPDQEVLLDDGKILLSVLSQGESDTSGFPFARVLRGGPLTSRKSLALPGTAIHPPAMTDQDMANLAVARQFGVTGVMQPFVRSREDLEAVRAALYFAGAGDIRLFAKIENLEGVEKLPELLPAADEIVIARGDLGNSLPLWKLPAAQKLLASLCRKADKPFMVVTQMLSSMEHTAVPTRAEVSDIFNAVLDGASSVMVTGETAVGRYPAEVIRYLVKTGEAALEWMAMQQKTEE